MDIRTALTRYNRFLNALPDIVADEMINFVLDNFDSRSYEGRDWPDRKDGDSSRALLVQSGRGRRSVRISRKTRNAVSVTTDLEYMVAHNDGAEITRVITPRMRRFFWAMHYLHEANPDGTLKIPEGDVRWKWMALKKGSITFRMPQRQFIGPSEELNDRIKSAIEREMNQLFTLI